MMTSWLWCLLALNSVALLATVGLFFAGSLETFPTEEQESGVRIVWGLFSAIFVMTEGLLLWLLKRRKR